MSFTMLIRSLISENLLDARMESAYILHLPEYSHSQTNVFFRGVSLKIEGGEGGLSCIWGKCCMLHNHSSVCFCLVDGGVCAGVQ
jgi:hypothetical protein